MSTGDDNTPWNKRPKNGIKSFFSEAAFCQWVGEDTHESRLLDRLKKVNVSLSTKQPSSPWFLSTPDKPVIESNNTAFSCSSRTSEDHAISDETMECDKNATNIRSKEKIDILAQKLWSDVQGEDAGRQTYGTDYITEQTLHSKPSNGSEDVICTNKVTDENVEHNIICEDITASQQIADSNQVVMKQNVDNKIFNTAKLGASVGEGIEDDTKDRNVDKDISASIDGTDTAGSLIKPGFFYKDSTQVREEVCENVETLEETSSDINQTGNPSKLGNNQTAQAAAINEQSKVSSVVMETESDSQKSGKRGYIPLDPMFYNIKDRKAEKYFPEIFKKKPRNRFSRLTSHEQKVYLELLQMYGKANPTQQDLADESYHKFVKMTEIVSREQQSFQSYLRSISRICKADYQYIHPEVEKYVTARFLRKKKEVFSYPRFYNFMGKFELTDDVSGTPPTLQYIRPLVKLGHVSKLVLPSILPGLPQPCVTTNCKKIDELCPIVPKVYSGTYVWNNVVCSRDANAEQLAVPNKCDIVMSSSSVKHLVDNQGTIYKYWDMPFTVREYKLTEGDAEITHKVVYIDKPIIRQSQFVPKERIQLYQKYAIRASSIRNNQRGHMFCSIKPIHEVIANHDVNDITEQIKDYEEKLKDTLETESGSTESDINSVQKDMRKRPRKGAALGKKTQGGMFEAQDDIDDLETFGMDSYVTLKSKDVDAKNSNTETEVKESGLVKTKSKKDKSAVNDLELLRKELSGIRSLAMKEAAQIHDVDTTRRVSDDKHNAGKEEEQKPDIHLTDDDNNRNTDNKTIDTESMTEDVHARNTESKSEVTKCGVLSVKNLSSLSEKMKQMSAIKYKHEKLMSNSEPSSGVVQKQSIVTMKSTRLSESNETKCRDNVVLKDVEDEGLDTKEDDSMLLDVDTASDSDEEALVIDLPTDENTSHQSIKASTETLRTENMSHDQSEEKLDTVDTPTISTDTELSMSGLKMESSGGKSKPESLNTRRKRQYAGNTSLDVTFPKRLLRSAANKDESVQGTCSRITRSSMQRSEPETSRLTTSQTDSKTVPSPAGRGRKRTCTDIRMTRSRSVSAEDDHTSSHSEKVSLRTSRRSLPSTVDECSRSIENETNLLPRKPSSSHKKKKIEEKLDSKEPLVDRSELDATTKSNTRSSIELIDEVTKDKDEDLCEVKVKGVQKVEVKVKGVQKVEVKVKDVQEVKTSGRKKSETENDDVSKIEHTKLTNTKKSKRTSSENNESKKIKEMAKALKVKIEERAVKVKPKCKDDKVADDLKNMSKKLGNTEMDKEQKGDKMQTQHKSDEKKTEDSDLTSSNMKSTSWPGNNPDSGSIPGIPENRNKKSNAEMFAANHGMSHCGYPVEGNVTYHQWNLAGINILIRCKYHGFISGQGLVHLCPKMEYQPNFGFENDTLNEITRNWISVYTRPNSSLLKARINPYNSEIMMFETVAYQDLVPSSCEFSPAQAFTDLHVIMDKLKSLPVGEYILKNNPRKDMFSIMKATDSNKRGTFDLHHQHSSYMKTDVPNSIQWTPLDTKLLLPHQRKSHLIPCTYQPKDVKPGSKTSPKHTKKKGKKGKKQK